MASKCKLIVEDFQIQTLRDELNLNNPELVMSEKKLKRGIYIEIDFLSIEEMTIFLENIREKGIPFTNKSPL